LGVHLCAEQRGDAQGVVTGSVLQGMALTVPIGGPGPRSWTSTNLDLLLYLYVPKDMHKTHRDRPLKRCN
jgi:hypothetical protein